MEAQDATDVDEWVALASGSCLDGGRPADIVRRGELPAVRYRTARLLHPDGERRHELNPAGSLAARVAVGLDRGAKNAPTGTGSSSPACVPITPTCTALLGGTPDRCLRAVTRARLTERVETIGPVGMLEK